jgi:hypothetical protein
LLGQELVQTCSNRALLENDSIKCQDQRNAGFLVTELVCWDGGRGLEQRIPQAREDMKAEIHQVQDAWNKSCREKGKSDKTTIYTKYINIDCFSLNKWMCVDEGSGPTKLRIFSVKYQISYQLWANKFGTRGNYAFCDCGLLAMTNPWQW